MSSHQFVLETFIILKDIIPSSEEDHKKDFQNIGDSIAHTAPEIIHTAWKRMFNYCSENFNDQTCEWHTTMCDIYNKRYNEWIRLESK